MNSKIYIPKGRFIYINHCKFNVKIGYKQKIYKPIYINKTTTDKKMNKDIFKDIFLGQFNKN